jgi:hypothetical protein
MAREGYGGRAAEPEHQHPCPVEVLEDVDGSMPMFEAVAIEKSAGEMVDGVGDVGGPACWRGTSIPQQVNGREFEQGVWHQGGSAVRWGGGDVGLH